MTLPDPPILVITDRRQCGEALEARAEALFRGGCRWLSVREKDLPPAERLALLRRLAMIGRDHGACVGVHDDIATARNLGIALHLPADANARMARAEIGGTLLGQSCHDAAELVRANAAGVDYATLGPVGTTPSKPGYRPMSPIGDLATVIRRSAAPVIALGGVTIDLLPQLKGLGFAGIAAMGEPMRVPVPASWFETLALAWRGTAEPTRRSIAG